MAELKWLVENYTETDTVAVLIESIKKQGYKCVNKLEIPSYMDVSDYFDKDDNVISYTSIQTAREIARKPWYPGTFANFNEYKCSQFYPKLSQFLFNEDYMMIPYGDLLRKKDFIFNIMGRDNCIFIRPDDGFKTFSGTVLEKERFEKDVPMLGYGDIDPSVLVLISTPGKITREWRLFASEAGVITGSQYKKGDNKELSKDVPQGVVAFAEEVVKAGYFPDPVISIDVCESGDTLNLLEVGCFSCSGLYLAETDPLVEIVSKKAIESWNDLFQVKGE